MVMNVVMLCACSVALVVAVLSVLAGAYAWLADPETPKVFYHCSCFFGTRTPV